MDQPVFDWQRVRGLNELSYALTDICCAFYPLVGKAAGWMDAAERACFTESTLVDYVRRSVRSAQDISGNG
jgi:hypothetical protein